MRPLLAALTVSLTIVVSGGAQSVPDHLKCYAIKDPQPRATYTASINGLTPEAGCRISVPAKMLCVEAVKSGVTPPPPGGGPSGTPAGRFLCYNVKCPKTTLPVAGADQFGARIVTVTKANLLCAPFGTTTTTTSTTTTTNPPCISGGCAPCGSCGNGECHASGGGGGCGAPGPDPVCVDATTCSPSTCTAAGGCPVGSVCVFKDGPSECCSPCP